MTQTTKCPACDKTIQKKEPGSVTYVKDITNPDFCECIVHQTTTKEDKIPCIMQSDDMLRGRIIAMRSMIGQFENEIKQLESNLRTRGMLRKQETDYTFQRRRYYDN